MQQFVVLSLKVAANLDLPALHKIAGDLSDKFQFRYLLLVCSEYFALFVASVLSLDLENTKVYYLAYAMVFIIGLAVLIIRSFTKPEQSWYRSRAVAESVKTSAWRYAMASHPYNEEQPKKHFLNLLREILRANKVLSEGGNSSQVGYEQVTLSMDGTRLLPLQRRVTFYLENRVADQRRWYLKKASLNRRAFIFWVWISGVSYAIASSLALSRIAFPEWKIVPIEPLIVIASSIVGWVQIKKHSELAASYTLTATEIGIAAEDAQHFDDEKLFSDFVNDTELAFSREHTQWIARQQTAG